MRAILALTLLLLAAVIGWELRPGALPVAPAPGVSPPLRQAAPEDLATTAQEQGWVATILGRPLFSPSRRPAAPAGAPQASRTPVPRLSGIVMDGTRRTALFAAAGKQRAIIVAEGGEIDGYRVESIGPGGVVLTGAGLRQVLRPTFDANAAPPAPVSVVPLTPQSAPPTARDGEFDGPPGLSAMPKPRASTAAGPPGLPGLPSLNNLTGIPGLPAPQAPPK